MPKRFEVYYVDLNPTVGSEINKERPCIIVSPDTINNNLNTVIVAPLSSSQKKYPSRVDCIFQKRPGQICLDQIRAIDQTRLKKMLGVMDSDTNKKVCEVLEKMFSYK